jgi:hypothetical protein
MSDRLIQVLAAEETLAANTATNVSLAHVVKIHIGGTERKLTVKDASGNTIGSTTVHANDTVFIRKKATDTVEANGAGCLATSIAFGD